MILNQKPKFKFNFIVKLIYLKYIIKLLPLKTSKQLYLIFPFFPSCHGSSNIYFRLFKTDSTNQQPASKRQRNESNNSNHNSNTNSSNNNSNSRNVLNQKQDSSQQTGSTAGVTLSSKRIATRRQSLVGLPSEINHTNNKTHDKGQSNKTSHSSSTSTTHTLRTRLSVPLTNKAEKR